MKEGIKRRMIALDGKTILMIFAGINILTFFIFGWDKMQARRGAWRVSEKALFLWVLIGGGLGGIAGMKVWRHKTKKWYFKFGIPTLVVIQGGALLYIKYFME